MAAVADIVAAQHAAEHLHRVVDARAAIPEHETAVAARMAVVDVAAELALQLVDEQLLQQN